MFQTLQSSMERCIDICQLPDSRLVGLHHSMLCVWDISNGQCLDTLRVSATCMEYLSSTGELITNSISYSTLSFYAIDPLRCVYKEKYTSIVSITWYSNDLLVFACINDLVVHKIGEKRPQIIFEVSSGNYPANIILPIS